jgi:hypothetical protein
MGFKPLRFHIQLVPLHGGAMATAGNDDRLYVFEAFGLLLGIDDVPEVGPYKLNPVYP